MRNSLIAFLLLISTAVNAQDGDKNFIDQNYIEVIGKSEMEVSPDMIYLKVFMNEKDTKNKISLAELETKMVERLKEIGIDVAKDLLIKDISSNFKYYLFSGSDILLSKEYQVLVRDGKTASKVFIELEKIGISNVSIDRLDHSNIIQFRKDVKVNAIKASRDKAELLTLAINQNVGRAIFIQEIENMVYDNRSSNSIMVRGISSNNGGNAALPELDFEKIKLEASILCRFELK